MNIGKNNPSKEEKRKQKIVEKERKQYHNELIKEANKTYNEEKIAPNDSFISLVNVNKIYDNHVQAVFNFNLDIKENEFIEGKDGMYTIKSPMGTGKSTVIKRIIQEGLQNDMRILIITNRISVAEDFKQKYNIKIYNKDEYSIGDSLICQFDSLWKYNIKNFDLVILDEFISLLFHARNTINNSQINLAKFFASFNLKLVIADAFLTGYENKLLNKNSNMFFLNNVYRDETKLYEYNNFNYFIQKILRKA